MSAASADSPLRIGSEPEFPPFCVVDTLGRPDGFSVELISAAIHAMGKNAIFQNSDWATLKNRLLQGEVDALPLVGRTPERDELFDFTFPYITLSGAIVIRKGMDSIKTLEDLRGRQVAVMKADSAEEFLLRQEIDINMVPLPSFDVALKQLSSGLHEAVLMQRLTALRLISEHKLSNLRVSETPLDAFRQEFCFAVRKGDSATLAMLNEGLSVLIADGTFRRLHAKWFATLELPTNRLIITGGDHNYPPYEFLDENGKPDGFAVELIQAVARAVNINLDIRLGPWPAMLQSLENGTIDAIPSIFYSPERSQKFDFSIPHAFQHYVSAVRSGQGPAPASIEDLQTLRLVAQEGDLITDLLKEHGLNDQFYTVPAQEDVLKHVMEGLADCGLVMRLSAMSIIKDRKWESQLRLGRQPLHQAEYCIAVRKGNNALLSLFNEGLQTIKDSGEYREIHEKWFGMDDRAPSIADFIKKARWVLLPLLTLLALSVLWTWTLRTQVGRQTEHLLKNQNRIRHLNRILKAVRNINKLIVRERDRERLIQEACDLLTETRGYAAAMIMLSDEEGKINHWCCDQGSTERMEPFRSTLDAGEPPSCCSGENTDEQAPIIIQNSDETCLSCPIALANTRSMSLCARLIHQKVLYGYLIVAMDEKPTVENEEVDLFAEIAGDLSYALHGIQAAQHHAETEKERKILEGQLQQSSRIEAIGQLAGGVAHDFNNLLMGIMGYTEICLDEIEEGHPVREHLNEIMQGAKRSADLTRQLLAFARRQTIKPEVLDLNDAISGMLKLLQRLLGEDIDLLWMPGGHVWPIKIDPSQIDQILANLCINARDAIAKKGKLTIETSRLSIDENFCRLHAEASVGDFVMLSISDNGCGIEADVLEHIFEPFFTTKSREQGTGLGLATVYGIVRQNNGFVNVYSEPGKGTTFRIYLPRVEIKASDQRLACKASETTPLPQGNETILLVEDDDSIRHSTAYLLKSFGYQVLAAPDPEQALQMAEDHTGHIDLLLTDVIMPGMSGKELAYTLLSKRPSIRVLYMSGYTANVIAHHGVLEDGIEFLAKPVTRATLTTKVRAVLDAPATAARL